MRRLDILRKIGGVPPQCIVWPVDNLSLLECSKDIGLDAGLMYLDMLPKGKMAYSSFLSKGKPPERRRRLVVFVGETFAPVYIECVMEGKTPIFTVISDKTEMTLAGDQILKYLETFGEVSDPLPCVAPVREKEPLSSSPETDKSDSVAQI